MKYYHVLLWHQYTLCVIVAGWSSPVARQAHNLKVVGSNPTPATNFLISLAFMSDIPIEIELS